MKTLILFIVLNLLSNASNAEQIRQYSHSNLSFPSNGNILKLNVNDEEVNFFMIADWGGIQYFPYRTFVQQMIANSMVKIAKKKNVHFTLALGDNFYDVGVKNVDDPRFQTTFENVFPLRYLNMPWFIQLGNHDYLGNETAQIAYTNRSTRWILPNYFYSVNVNVQEKKLIHIIMIDTDKLCGNADHPDNFDLNLKGPAKELSDYYFNQIEDELKKVSKEKIPFVIIAGHYPLWSISFHGPTYLLVNKLRPLLFKYKVNVYFYGHDHTLEYYQETLNDTQVNFVLNGATDLLRGKNNNHADKVPKEALKYYWSGSELNIHGALCLIKANIQEMVIEFIETNGNLLYKTKIPNRWLENFQKHQ